jgi:DNA polymerase-3 subunit delta'
VGFGKMIGQNLTVTALKRSLQTGKLTHAYLFSGPAGSGKKTMASLFIKGLNCKNGGERPCNSCLPCQKINSGNHPDIYVLKPQGSFLKIEQLREIREKLYHLPAEGSKKICIMESAESLTLPAANSLLKILEEPPRHLIFILLSARPWALLPTIVSRCAHFVLKPLTVKEMNFFLTQNTSLTTEEEKEIIVALAGGNPGKALEMVSEGNWLTKYEEIWGLIDSIERGPLENIFSSAEIVSQKKDVQEMLDLMLIIYRERLLSKLSGRATSILLRNLLALNHKEAKDIAAPGLKDVFSLEKICHALLEVQGELLSNVNRRLSLEVLFLKMRGVV